MRIKKHIFYLLTIFAALSLFREKNLFAQENDNEAKPEIPQKSYSEKIVNPRETLLKISYDKLENLKKLLEQDPDNIDYLLKAADLEIVLTNTKNAINYYRKAVALMKKNPEIPVEKIIQTQREIILLFARSNETNLAIVEFKRLCDIQPNNLNLKKEFADFLIDSRYPRRAFLVYKEILKSNPDDNESIEKIMLLHARQHVSKDEIDSVLTQK